MKWNILVPYEDARVAFRNQLHEELERQIGEESKDIAVLWFSAPMEIGPKRDYVRATSLAEYVSFFDSDDWPAPDYVSSILPNLNGVDIVSFDIAVLQDYQEAPTIRGPALNQNSHRWHLFPMRRELAMLEPFEGGPNEDSRWTDRMKARDVVKTEHYIARPLYYYLHRAPKIDQLDATDKRRLKLIDRISRSR